MTGRQQLVLVLSVVREQADVPIVRMRYLCLDTGELGQRVRSPSSDAGFWTRWEL